MNVTEFIKLFCYFAFSQNTDINSTTTITWSLKLFFFKRKRGLQPQISQEPFRQRILKVLSKAKIMISLFLGVLRTTIGGWGKKQPKPYLSVTYSFWHFNTYTHIKTLLNVTHRTGSPAVLIKTVCVETHHFLVP